MRRPVLTAAMILAASTFSWAQSETPKTAAQPAKAEPAPITLHVGDKAPPLSVGEWVKGSETTGFEKGRTYVVEFWATWCGPCIASMPHLTSLQKEYGDRIQIIGVTKEDPNNSLDTVKKFVTDKGDGMGYTVAWDKDKETSAAYMKAAGRNGIPCSFVVDGTGTVAYIGHPMWLDMPLERITKGTWDYKEGMATIAAAEEKLKAVSAAAAKDPKDALAKLRELETEHPAVGDVMSSLKFNLLSKGADAESRAECRKMVMTAYDAKDAAKLNTMARALVNPDVKEPDLDLALKAATRAVEIDQGKAYYMLDTLAKVQAAKGDKAAAIETQKKALAAAPEARKESMKKALDELENGKK